MSSLISSVNHEVDVISFTRGFQWVQYQVIRAGCAEFSVELSSSPRYLPEVEWNNELKCQLGQEPY